MAINFQFKFKNEDAIMVNSAGEIVSVTADLIGVCDSDGKDGMPKGIACHAVTISRSQERGTLPAADPANFTPLEQVTHEQAAGWLVDILKSEPGPRGKGHLNMWIHYQEFIKKQIPVNKQTFLDQLSEVEPESHQLGTKVTEKPEVAVPDNATEGGTPVPLTSEEVGTTE